MTKIFASIAMHIRILRPDISHLFFKSKKYMYVKKPTCSRSKILHETNVFSYERFHLLHGIKETFHS